MNQRHVLVATLLIFVLFLCGCPMDRTRAILSINNESDQAMSIMLNKQFPDSSLGSSYQVGLISGRGTKVVHDLDDLTKAPGLTIFLFDLAYSKTAIPDNEITPDGDLLERDSVLKMFYHTNAQLDSLGWVLVYP